MAAAADADILTAKTAAEEKAQDGARANDAALRAVALLDGLEPGEYAVEGRRVTVVVLGDDRDDSPSLLASAARRVGGWESETPYPVAATATSDSGGRISASMAAGVLAAIGMLGMLAGVLSLPRTGGLESMAIVRPAPEFTPGEPTNALPAGVDSLDEVAGGATAVASAR